MIADLPLVDQVWYLGLIVAIVTGSLAILVLLGPAWLRDARDIFGDRPTAREIARLQELERREALRQIERGRRPLQVTQGDVVETVLHGSDARRIVLVVAILAGLGASACGSSPAGPSVAAPMPPEARLPLPAAPGVPRPVGFDLGFWTEFAHGTRDNTGPVPLARLTGAPMVYLRTVDDDGAAVDPVTLATVEAAFRDVALTWGGGRVGLAGVVRVAAVQDGLPGTLTVRWRSTAVLGRICGRSVVGVDGGTLEFNYHSGIPICGCNGSAVSPLSARHELGHAFGYWHTSHVDDVMNPTIAACDGRPSPREVLHAAYAYQLPIGAGE